MIEWLDAISTPFLKKRLHAVLYLAVFNQWLMMRLITMRLILKLCVLS
ncbi:hypothetical protein [Helicobacter pylori]|nr:hypothetical protein [Helicobacter pylori]